MTTLFRLSGAEKRDPTIQEWLNKSDASTATARTWFKKIRACGDDVLEVMHDGHPTACVGDAAFAYVNAFTAHVNVGFFRGATLPDPAGLLQGDGKYMRHVKLKPDTAVDVASLETLITAAYLDIRTRLAVD